MGRKPNPNGTIRKTITMDNADYIRYKGFVKNGFSNLVRSALDDYVKPRKFWFWR